MFYLNRPHSIAVVALYRSECLVSNNPVVHPNGQYRYLPAIDAYSSGVAAQPGHAITALHFRTATPLAEAFARIDREIAARGLVAQALIGVELRSPGAFSFESFQTFNTQYRQLLDSRGLIIDGVNPVSRTNVIPLRDGPAEPSLLSAYIVHPSDAHGTRDFVIAGSGEVRGALLPDNITARGDVSASGLALKAETVREELADRLAALDTDATQPTTVNVYTAHDIDHLTAKLAAGFPSITHHGYVRWLAKPPVEEIEFEMDCSRVSARHYI